jgi:hypothetical protein
MKKNNGQRRAYRLALAMIDAGIQLIAVDFDRTIVEVHTGGRWKQSSTSLSTKIRPFFEYFLKSAQRAGLWVAVVTFSPQTQLVADTMSIGLGGEQQIKRCFLRGEDGGWTRVTKAEGSWRHINLKQGKLGHIYSVVQHIQKLTQQVRLSPQDVFYIDDDLRNVDIARQAGIIHSAWCPATYEPISCGKLLMTELENKYLHAQPLKVLGNSATKVEDDKDKKLTRTCLIM